MTEASAPTPLVYGEIYHIQNEYNSWGGGFLDTRGAGCQGNKLCVSTATGRDRDKGSGTWRIIPIAPRKNGDKVLFNEPLHFFNLYDNNGGYLDTRDAGCEGNKLCVSTADSENRDQGSGTWKIIPNSESQSVIHENEVVHILNGYGGWNGGFLDTRGSGCQGNLLCVSTTEGWNRGTENTTHWRFIKAHLKK